MFFHLLFFSNDQKHCSNLNFKPALPANFAKRSAKNIHQLNSSPQIHRFLFEGCGKEFKFKSVLREHRKTHYPADCDWMADPDPDMTIDQFFVCTYCGKR